MPKWTCFFCKKKISGQMLKNFLCEKMPTNFGTPCNQPVSSYRFEWANTCGRKFIHLNPPASSTPRRVHVKSNRECCEINWRCNRIWIAFWGLDKVEWQAMTQLHFCWGWISGTGRIGTSGLSRRLKGLVSKKKKNFREQEKEIWEKRKRRKTDGRWTTSIK
jgi:hypothetical protein